jgi:hypothetical protein
MDNPAHIVLEVVNKTVSEWKENNPPEKIKKDTLKILEKNSEEILFQLLGFVKDDWGSGKFRLDHCNGRSGNSAAGDYIRQNQQEAINIWLAATPLPSLTAAMKKEIAGEAQRHYRQTFREQFYQLVENAAKQEADKAFKEISGLLALNKHEKTVRLIEGT